MQFGQKLRTGSALSLGLDGIAHVTSGALGHKEAETADNTR